MLAWTGISYPMHTTEIQKRDLCMKIQDCILEILMTALLEGINLFISVFDAHNN